MPHPLSRRDFVKSTAALAAAPAFLRPQGANNKIAIGWVSTDLLVNQTVLQTSSVARQFR